MTQHAIGTREEWLAARRELLDAEKAHMRHGDELARRRQELPWVPVEGEYVFETEDGRKTLAELFDGRSQLVVYHFMFPPEDDEGCPSCSFWADSFDANVVHLNARDTATNVTPRAFRCTTLASKLSAQKEQLGQPSSSSGGNMKW